MCFCYHRGPFRRPVWISPRDFQPFTVPLPGHGPSCNKIARERETLATEEMKMNYDFAYLVGAKDAEVIKGLFTFY